MTWTAVAVLLAGIVIGAGIKFGRLRMRGVEVVVPYIERTDQAFTVGVVVVTLMSLVTIVQTNSSQARTSADQVRNENCAREFRNALAYNTMINADTRKREGEIDDALTTRRLALDDLIDGIGPGGIASRAALDKYRATAADVEVHVARLKLEQDTAEKTRAPYPDPTCGR